MLCNQLNAHNVYVESFRLFWETRFYKIVEDFLNVLGFLTNYHFGNWLDLQNL